MKRIIYMLLAGVLLIGPSGCGDDFLDTLPTDAISEEEALATPENMMLVINGLHREMYGQSILPGASANRSGQSYYMPVFDAIGGQVLHSSPGNGWLGGEAAWNVHINANFITVMNLWYQRYHFIASVNAIINKVMEDDILLDEEMNNVLGQAYAYRAWAYHQLVMTYAKGYLISADPGSEPGVPLLFKTESPYNSEPRSSVQVIYDQIQDDIERAIELLAVASAPNNKSHISLNAAYGIKARIELSKGDWAAAAQSAAMAREGYALMDEGTYLSGFNTLDLSEVIWGGHVISSETNFFAAYFYYIGTNFNGTQNRTNPKFISRELYGMIPETDYRRNLWLPLAPNTNPNASNGQGGSYLSDPNYDSAEAFQQAYNEIIAKYNMTSAFNTHPYMSVKFLNKNGGTTDPDDVIYMRSSEMYLIEAEAYAMLGQVAESQTALAVVGMARNTAYDVTQFATSDALMDEIKFQRQVELWGEGFAYHDKIRWDEGLDQSNSGAALVLYQDGFMQEQPSLNPRWVFRIPQREIDTNPNLTENDQNKY